MTDFVIFSIDNVTDAHTLYKFLRWFDQNKALQKTKGNLVTCIGKWKGALEQSFISTLEDYEKLIKPLGFTKNQESILIVSGSKMETFLVDKEKEHFVGRLVSVPKEEAFSNDGFTYRPDVNTYWVIK